MDPLEKKIVEHLLNLWELKDGTAIQQGYEFYEATLRYTKGTIHYCPEHLRSEKVTQLQLCRDGLHVTYELGCERVFILR